MQNNKVLNKIGKLSGMMCDVGIVDDDKGIILISVFTTTQKYSSYASNLIADLSAKAYNVLRTK